MCVYDKDMLLSLSFFQVYDEQSVDDGMRCLSQGTSAELSGFTGVPPAQLHRAGNRKGPGVGLMIKLRSRSTTYPYQLPFPRQLISRRAANTIKSGPCVLRSGLFHWLLLAEKLITAHYRPHSTALSFPHVIIFGVTYAFHIDYFLPTFQMSQMPFIIS